MKDSHRISFVAVLGLSTSFGACSSSPANVLSSNGGNDGGGGGSLISPDPNSAPPPGSCGMPNPAFCDTFDTPSHGEAAGDNGGDLNDNEWSVARLSDFENDGQNQLNTVIPTATFACGQTNGTGQPNTVPGMGVLPPNDFFFCAGGGTPSSHLNTAFDDLGQPIIQSFRVRRPFDFANRTGVIAFDVDGQAQSPSGHGYWFNVFISADPAPAPYQDIGIGPLYVKDGVAIEFEATPAPCGSDGTTAGVSNFFVQEDYGKTHSYHPPDSSVICFQTQPEVMNHIEIHINQNSIEVFASDAGNPSSLRSVAKSDALDLRFTRGYVSLQHTQYNAVKGNNGLLPSYHTYHWDNVAFDGPPFRTPRAYEVAMPLVAHSLSNYGSPTYDNAVNTGWVLQTTGLDDGTGNVQPVSLANVDLTDAVDAWLTMDTFVQSSTDTIAYRFNGGTWRNYSPPLDQVVNGQTGTADEVIPQAIPVALSDLRAGTNTLEVSSTSSGVLVSNIELTLDVQ